MSVEYKPIGSTSGAIPASTKIRTSASTQDGYTDAEIQHVKLDTGDGTNIQPVSGTVTSNPSVLVLVTGTRASGDGVGDIINVDTTIYRHCTVQVTGTWSGTITFGQSNDNVTYYNIFGRNENDLLAQVSTAAANGLYSFGLGSAYFRARWTTATSGTVSIVAYFSKDPINPTAITANLALGAAQALKAEDSAHASGDYGIMNLAVRKDTATALAGADGDYAPLEVDVAGRMWVRLGDQYGWYPEYTPTDDMRVVEPIRLVGAQFEGTTVDALFWTATVANSATIAQANAEIVLSSGTNAAGSAKLNTVRRARYIAGSSMRCRAVVQLSDVGKTNNTKKWGVAWGATMPTVTDGAYFQLSGTTFSIVTLKGTVATVVNSGSFNGTVASYAPDINVATYEIYWTNSKVWFVVGGVLIHTVTASTATWAATMNHHVYMDNINSGNTTNTTLSCRVASIYRMGKESSQPASYYQSGTTAGVILKYGPGNLHGITVSGVVNNAAITLYDNTAASGTIIWSSGAMGANTVPFDIDFHELPFSIGLTILIATANANATVMYE